MGRIKIEVQHVGGEIELSHTIKICDENLALEHTNIRDGILNGLVRYKSVVLKEKGKTTIIPVTDIMRIEIESIEDEKPAKIEVKQA